MENRKFPRIRLKELGCVIHNGSEFLAVGTAEREVFALILDLSSGGALIKTNITSQKNAQFSLQFPNVANLESFSVKCKIARVTKSPDSEPLKPRYILGLEFIDPEVNQIKDFIEVTFKIHEDTK